MAVTKLASLDRLEDFEELGRALLERGLIVRVGVANGLDVLSEVTEQECVLLADVLGDLNVGAVDGAEKQCTVQAELHVTSTRGLGTGCTDLNTDVRSGDQNLGDRDAVVGNETDAQEVADVGVLVDDLGNIDDEADDQLGNVVARRGLAGKDGCVLDKLFALLGRRLLDLEVTVDDTKDVEGLALVLVQALDLTGEHAVNVHVNAEISLQDVGKAELVLNLDVAELLAELFVLSHGQKLLNLLQVD